MDNIIYIAKAENGLYKIGQANDLLKRIRSLNSQSPIQINLIHAANVERVNEKEKEVHYYLASYRVRGEWFNLPDVELDKAKAIIGGQPLNLSEIMGTNCIAQRTIGQYTIYQMEHGKQLRMSCPRCLHRRVVRVIDGLYQFQCTTCDYKVEFTGIEAHARESARRRDAVWIQPPGISG